MRHEINGLHHVTLSTGSAQGDVDFFVKVIGHRLLKKTLFYDGDEPIYHLYFGDYAGTPGTLMTTFPTRRTGRKGRPGSGQISRVTYSVPAGSLGFWKDHLGMHGIAVRDGLERFGQPYIALAHPDCGIGFEIMEEEGDERAPYDSPFVPLEHAIRGFHSWTASVGEREDMDWFLKEAWSTEEVAREGAFTRYRMGAGGPGRLLDVVHEPDLRQGTWIVAEGTVHHAAFEVPTYEEQDAIKFAVEGMGFTDFSDRKDRGYFDSIYVRTPGGVLFEACVSKGFTVDEPLERLGEQFFGSPQMRGREDEVIASMNDPIEL